MRSRGIGADQSKPHSVPVEGDPARIVGWIDIDDPPSERDETVGVARDVVAGHLDRGS